MSSNAIIQVENLGKRYRISHQAERQSYVALRDVIAQKAKRLFARSQTSDLRPPTSGTEDFWALKDVSFEVKRGEVVGIIGRNGAGKSTLLKILSRITEPTEGRICIDGRVASLLEVGTGFHPELTGRENIFLNGAILGMHRAEIKQKFDEIVAFAEVEKFLDTPVKRYSSGMYVRLAFAVAAHLEPEILIVDEVLAVGDAEFQKKCLGKMQDVSRGGRAVLFVSHNMGAVNNLCKSCIHLNRGKVVECGPTSHVVGRYLNTSNQRDRVSQTGWCANKAPGVDCLRILSASVKQLGSATRMVDISKPFEIMIVLRRTLESAQAVLGIQIENESGQVVLLAADAFADNAMETRQGILRCSIEFPAYLLNIGGYSLSLSADIPNVKVLFKLENVIQWSAESSCQVMGRYRQKNGRLLSVLELGNGALNQCQSLENYQYAHKETTTQHAATIPALLSKAE